MRGSVIRIMGKRCSTLRAMRSLPVVAVVCLLLVSFVVSGCKDSDPVGMGNVDASRTPTMLTRDVETLISDSGVTRFRIVTPIWYVYDEVEEPLLAVSPKGLTSTSMTTFSAPKPPCG